MMTKRSSSLPPAVVVAVVTLCVWGAVGASPPSSFHKMSPRGIITADMIQKNRQSASRDFKVPPPVQSYSHVQHNNPTYIISQTDQDTDEEVKITVVKSEPVDKKDVVSFTQDDAGADDAAENAEDVEDADDNSVDVDGRSLKTEPVYQHFYNPARTGPVDQVMTATKTNSEQQPINNIAVPQNAINAYLQNPQQSGSTNLNDAQTLNALYNNGAGLATVPSQQLNPVYINTNTAKNLQQHEQSFRSHNPSNAQLLMNKLAMEKNYNDLQHQLEQQKQIAAFMARYESHATPTAGTSVLNNVINPFREFGRSFIKAISPLVSPSSTVHHMTMPMPRSTVGIDKKFDFGGAGAGSSPSGSYGAPPTTINTGYGTPTTTVNTGYGTPTTTVNTGYGAPTVTTGYGGGIGIDTDPLSVINSDSLPFFAAAAATSAIAAFAVGAIAAGTQTWIGRKKRSLDGEEEIAEDIFLLRKIVEYVADNYHDRLEEGFQQIADVTTDSACANEVTCRAVVNYMENDNDVFAMAKRMDTAFELLHHRGSIRDQLRGIFEAAETRQCHKFGCVNDVLSRGLSALF